jgi:hypothetical protein
MNTTDDTKFYIEELTGTASDVGQALEQLARAERGRRVSAAIAVRAGLTKTVVSTSLGVTRPTLDAWLKQVAETPDEQSQVDSYFAFVARESNPATAVHAKR